MKRTKMMTKRSNVPTTAAVSSGSHVVNVTTTNTVAMTTLGNSKTNAK